MFSWWDARHKWVNDTWSLGRNHIVMEMHMEKAEDYVTCFEKVDKYYQIRVIFLKVCRLKSSKHMINGKLNTPF